MSTALVSKIFAERVTWLFAQACLQNKISISASASQVGANGKAGAIDPDTVGMTGNDRVACGPEWSDSMFFLRVIGGSLLILSIPSGTVALTSMP